MSATLIQALQNPEIFPHPIEKFQLFETHISWVLLTGEYAYKIKKPLDFGFLDFSTLDKRHKYCQEEVRLNQRMAPELYLDVIAIRGREDSPQLDGDADVIEYAVRMREFPQDQLLSTFAEEGKLTEHHIDNMADRIAEFHQSTPVCGEDVHFGTAEMARRPVTENFRIIRPLLSSDDDIANLDKIIEWEKTRFQEIEQLLAKRKTLGFIRECHGDMHLGNAAVVDGKVTLFDCIEFNDPFRCIDVMSDLGFLFMDLEKRGLRNFAFRLLNRYLERTGDYEALGILRYYTSYRALVRAKIAMLRYEQCPEGDKERQDLLNTYREYIHLAHEYLIEEKPVLLITQGVSGTGKSTISQAVLERVGAVRIRSDVERKRLFGFKLEDNTGSRAGQDIYSPDASKKTFSDIQVKAQQSLKAGFTTIVDATFLKQSYRDLFKSIAHKMSYGFAIMSCQASKAKIAQLIQQRNAEGDDASEADVSIVEHQLEHLEPISSDEAEYTVVIELEESLNVQRIVKELQDKVEASYVSVASS